MLWLKGSLLLCTNSNTPPYPPLHPPPLHPSLSSQATG